MLFFFSDRLMEDRCSGLAQVNGGSGIFVPSPVWSCNDTRDGEDVPDLLDVLRCRSDLTGQRDPAAELASGWGRSYREPPARLTKQGTRADSVVSTQPHPYIVTVWGPKVTPECNRMEIHSEKKRFAFQDGLYNGLHP